MTRLEWNYEWTPHSSRVLYKRARCGRLRRLLLSANKIPLRWLARVLIRLSLWRRLFLGNSVGSACTHRQFRPLFDRVRYRQHFCLSLYLTYSDIIPVMILFPMWFTSLVISYCNFLPNQWHSFFFFFRFFSPFKDKDSFDLFRFSSIFLKKKKKRIVGCATTITYIQMTVALLIIRWQKVVARSWLEIWLENTTNVFFRKIGRADAFCISNNSLLIQLNFSIVSVIYPSWSEYLLDPY